MTFSLTIAEVLGILGLALLAWRLVVSRTDKLHTKITETAKEVKTDLKGEISRVETAVRDVATEVRRLSDNAAYAAGRQAERDERARMTGERARMTSTQQYAPLRDTEH